MFFLLIFRLLLGERLGHFSSIMYMGVVGFQDLAEKVYNQLGKHKVKKYSSRNDLHKRMLGLNPLFCDFVSGPKNGRGAHFHCKVCKRDVAMNSVGISIRQVIGIEMLPTGFTWASPSTIGLWN